MSELVYGFDTSHDDWGRASRVELYEDKIVIIKDRKKSLGVIGKALGNSPGDRTLYFDQITSIQIYDGGVNPFKKSGFLRFILPGGISEGRYTWKNVRSDSSAVALSREKDIKEAHKFKEAYEELRSKMHRQSRAPQGAQTQQSPAEEVKKLKGLMDEGIITEEEFNKKKKELLGL